MHRNTLIAMIVGLISVGANAQTVPIVLPEPQPAPLQGPEKAPGSPQEAIPAAGPTTNPPPAETPVVSPQARLAEAQALEKADKLIEARNLAYDLIMGPHDDLKSAIEELLGRVNIALISTPRAMPEKIEYTVKPGDSLGRIAKMFGTTEDLAQQSNLIKDPAMIRVGDLYRVFSGKFSVVVSKSRNDLVLSMNDRFFKRYRIGTGKFGKTPTGTFVIQDRIKEPVWWRPEGDRVPYGDKANILGTRWLALKATGTTPDVKGYGLHGTWDENSIGKQESLGCVRMRNADIEELYLLLPIGTPVTIEE